MKLIPLSKGLFAKVDDADYEDMAHYRWCVTQAAPGKPLYAVRKGTADEKKTVRMHRQIMGPEGALKVDHRNHDTLDNQRLNLRVATTQQNSFNMRARVRHGLKGVTFDKQTMRWKAQAMVNKKNYHLGRFITAEEARTAYLQFTRPIHGEFACL